MRSAVPASPGASAASAPGRPIPVWFAALALATVAASAASYLLDGDAALRAMNATWTVAALVALLGLAGGAAPARRPLMIAVGCWLIGQLIWDAYAVTGVLPGMPSVADGFWLAFAAISLLIATRAPSGDSAARVFVRLDLAAVIVACAAISGVLLYEAAERSALEWPGTAVAIAYPTLYGAAAINLAVRMFQIRSQQAGALLVLAGLTVEAVAFSLWSPLLLDGSYVAGHEPIDILWTLGLILIGIGGRLGGSSADGPQQPAGRERTVLRGGVAPGLGFAVLVLMLPVLALEGRPLGQRLIVQAAVVLVGAIFAVRFTLLSVRHLRLAEDERAARKELERSTAELDRFFATAPELLCVTDPAGYFTRVSPYCEVLLGYTPEEMLRRPFADYLHPDDIEATAAEVRRIFEGGELASFENRYRRADGSYATLHWVSVLAEEGDLIYAAASDVTERVRAEAEREEARLQAERANQAKNEFLSRMSHELRTPLNAVLGFGQLLEMDELPGTQGESVKHVLRGGRHLLALIDEVLDISRIEAGQMTLSVEPVDLSACVVETAALIEPLAGARGIVISVEEPEGTLPFVMADRQRLRQILLNLLSNAVKYNRDGGSIRVHYASSPRNGTVPRVQVSVTDTGVGLNTAQTERLFEPFDRLGAELTSVEGTGLGLALSLRLTTLMNGTLTVSSRLGIGSTFMLDLPAAEPVVEPIASESTRTTGPARPSLIGRRTLLYIEDNLANLQLVERVLLRHPGIELMPAMLGRLGLELAMQHRPDIILLDLHLPDITGAEALQRLRAHEATRDTPVIVLSADATERQMRELLLAGADAYLTKPLDVTRFLDLLQDTLTVRAPDPEPRAQQRPSTSHGAGG